jgi:protein phosphatase
VTDRSGGRSGAANAEPRIEVGLATDVGQVRTGNEDSIICEPIESLIVSERGLFCAVADGMGGHAAGEDASSMAVKVARDAFYGSSADADPMETLRLAVAQANAAVYEAGAGKTGRDHMGTTLTAAVMFNDRVVVGHVGDSRCYLVLDDTITQLSNDHSWVAEEVAAGRMTPDQARVNPRRNIITRALGLRPDVDVDAYEARLEPGNVVVICSDGLHGLVTEEEIYAYVTRLRPVDAVDDLIRLANDRGGPDNISVVIARVLGSETEEADTERGFPVLSETYAPTQQVELSEPADITTAQAAPLPDLDQSPEKMTASAPVVIPPAPESSPPSPAEPLDELHHHDPPTPRTPVQPQPLATTAPAPLAIRQPNARKQGAAALLVILLVVVLGATLGLVAFMIWFR